MKATSPEPLALHLLLSDDERSLTEPQSLSVAGHHEWRESLAGPARAFDEIDRALDDLTEIDPYNGDPPSRRSDKELNRVLSILDELESERGNG